MISELFSKYVSRSEGFSVACEDAWTNTALQPHWCSFLGVPSIDTIAGYELVPESVAALGATYLREVGCVPLRQEGGLFLLGTMPEVISHAEFCSCMLQQAVKPLLGPEHAVADALNATLTLQKKSDEHLLDGLQDAVDEHLLTEISVNELLDDTSEAPFIRAVNSIMTQAVQAGASDIHVEPYRNELRIRFRLDGVLYDKLTFPRKVHPPLVSRIKIMANLDIAEKRAPQDGRIALVLGGREVDLRVSTLPTTFGERVVLRLLEKSGQTLALEQTGFAAHEITDLRHMAGFANGIVLMTGPTGSGKTTTLYALLRELNSADRNILTIEDPVEYQLDGVGQTQVDTKKGLTFANGLRTLLRQDPDVILIGEIRDKETAEIAVQAAMTGHLVLSTLHTNDAPSAIIRLLDMGIEPYLLASVLRGVVSQRLVRTVCTECFQQRSISPQEWTELQADPEMVVAQACGCPLCSDTGYRGRSVVGEVMRITDRLQQGILHNADSASLKSMAEEEGMISLMQNGVKQIMAHQTTPEEIIRVSRI